MVLRDTLGGGMARVRRDPSPVALGPYPLQVFATLQLPPVLRFVEHVLRDVSHSGLQPRLPMTTDEAARITCAQELPAVKGKSVSYSCV